jgi:hypothetical protein
MLFRPEAISNKHVKIELAHPTSKGRWSPNDRLAYFPTGSKSSKKLCVLCGHLHVLCAALSGENLSPNYTVAISERNARSAVELLTMTFRLC